MYCGALKQPLSSRPTVTVVSCVLWLAALCFSNTVKTPDDSSVSPQVTFRCNIDTQKKSWLITEPHSNCVWLSEGTSISCEESFVWNNIFYLKADSVKSESEHSVLSIKDVAIKTLNTTKLYCCQRLMYNCHVNIEQNKSIIIFDKTAGQPIKSIILIAVTGIN